MKKLRYACLSLFLLFGLFVSSIGVTWCRYQAIHMTPIKYVNKTAGQFDFTSTSNEWILNSETQAYENEFTVINKNEHDNYLNIHLNTTQKATYSMILIEPSGREVSYDSILIQDNPLNYVYKFIDKEGKEIKIELKAEQKTKQTLRLEARNISDSFLSEIILNDASYEVESVKQTTTGQFEALTLTSNYLSSSEAFNVLLQDKTLDITLDSNMNVNSKIYSNVTNVLLNNQQELELTVEANKQATVTLDITNMTSESVTVFWEIYDSENNVIQTLKANFIINTQVATIYDVLPQVRMEYIEDKSTFNQYEPIQFMLLSDMDTTVQIGNDYPTNTHYTFDQGENWYVTTREGELTIPLQANIPTYVTIDLSKTDITWENIGFEVVASVDVYLLGLLEFEMEFIDLPKLEIVEENMGIMNENGLNFTINTEDVVITLEQYNEGTYIPLTEENFSLETEDFLTYTIKQNTEMPKGIYKVKIQQFYNNTLIKEEELSFFTIKEVSA